MTTRRFLMFAAPLLLALSAPAWASDIMVMGAQAPASLTPVAKTAAVYMVIMNHGTEADVLQSASAGVSEKAAAHQTQNDKGIMKMREVEGLEIKPNDMVTFAPGGYHIMLTGLKAPLKAGGSFPLVLHFKTAGDVSVDVKVVDKVEGANMDHDAMN